MVWKITFTTLGVLPLMLLFLLRMKCVMGATSSSMDLYLTLFCTDILCVYFDVLLPSQQLFSQVRTGLSGSIQYLAENKVYLLLKDSMQCLW